jgi:hypothetical protein
VGKTITAVIGKKKGESKTTLQTFIFPKEDWASADAVKSWLKAHDKSAELDITDSSYRARQEDPDKFEKGSFRTITITESASELDELLLSDATKSEVDGDHPASHYLVVEDSEKPSTWHLPVKDSNGKPDHGRMGGAWAALHSGFRGKKYEGPDKAKALAKLIALYKSEGMDTPSETADGREGYPADTKQFIPIQSNSNERRSSTSLCGAGGGTWLSSIMPDPVRSDGGVPLYRIPVAVTGSWIKNGHHFSITAKDLRDCVANFDKRKNGQIPIDYEHASEQPEVAQGKDVPAAGWIHSLSIAQNGKTRLMADVEWLEKAKSAIQAGEYRFFSPALDWDFRDKQSGEPQGCTMTSGALTNHPFLEELPPIHLTDNARSQGAVLLTDLAENKGVKTMKKLEAEELKAQLKDVPKGIIQKIPAGNPHAGQLSVHHHESGEALAYLTKSHLADAAAKHLDPDDDEPEDKLEGTDSEKQEELSRRQMRAKKGEEAEEAAELKRTCAELRSKNEELTGKLDALRKEKADMAEGAEAATAAARKKASEKTLSDIGCDGMLTADIKRLVEVGRGHSKGEGKRVLLRDACADGVLDKSKASFVANQHRFITTEDYVAVDAASAMVEEGVKAGKILPRERKFFLADALERPEEFKEWLKDAIPKVRFQSMGNGEGEAPSIDEEVNIAVKQYLSDHPDCKSHGKAHSAVMRDNPGLAQRYQQAHRPTTPLQ